MIAILVGCGPNSIEIPAMVFENFEQGLEFCEQKFERQPDHTFIDPATNNRSASWSSHKWESEDWSAIVAKFFLRYYDGCGDCYHLSLREEQFATPLVSWDLD